MSVFTFQGDAHLHIPKAGDVCIQRRLPAQGSAHRKEGGSKAGFSLLSETGINPPKGALRELSVELRTRVFMYVHVHMHTQSIHAHTHT